MAKNHQLLVTDAGKYEASIDDYFQDAAFLWARDADERSVLDLWLHVVDHCTRLVEAVRKERPREVIDDLADTVMWLLSFLSQLRRSNHPIDEHFRISSLPSDLIWNKYPGYCPACLDFNFTEVISKQSEESAKKALAGC